MDKVWQDFWPILMSLIGALIWLIRLESKLIYLEKDYLEQKLKNDEKDTSVWIKIDALQITMTSILQSLSKIEGRLERNSHQEGGNY